MQLNNIHADLDVNHHKWRADGSTIERQIKGGRYDNSSERLIVENTGALNLRLSGEHSLDHRLRLNLWQRFRMRRAVRAWRNRLTDNIFAKLGVPDADATTAGN